MMDRAEAEDYVYESYMRAEPYLDRSAPDRIKRDPGYTRDPIVSKSKTPSVVVTGSKGKGSVSAMISEILNTVMDVGLMTSPHIRRFNERIRVNGKEIDDRLFVKYADAVKKELNPIEETIPKGRFVSPMGIQTLIALSFFNDSGTDFNVFECGKGAKYDDVNNVIHDYAVINTVFPEHTRELGPSIEDIADDKKHVITENVRCVYTAKQEENVSRIIRDYAKENNVPLKEYGIDFFSDNIRYGSYGMTFDVHIDDRTYPDITLPLLGDHQARNCALAMALCEDVLKTLDLTKIREKLSHLDWPGRFETICTSPRIILDACINSKTCDDLIPVMERASIVRPYAVIGIPDDKDYLGVAMRMSSVARRIVLTGTGNPHYVFSPEQRTELERHGIESEWFANLTDALLSLPNDGSDIMILGTTSLISAAKELQRTGWFEKHLDSEK